MATPRTAPGTRRVVPVAPTGALGSCPAAGRWACEVFDGLLWQLVAMAATREEGDAFLRGE